MRYIDFTQTREGIEMTPCEELGYKVGDKFEVVDEHYKFTHGEIIHLISDDGTYAPKFCRSESIMDEAYVKIEKVRKITDSEGWIEWKGGECPVEKGTLVDVKYLDGYVENSVPALIYDDFGEKRSATSWKSPGFDTDIIAYRISNTDSCNCDGCTDGDASDQNEDITEQVDWSLDIITLISSVAPNVSVSDALEIASTLLENGFKK